MDHSLKEKIDSDLDRLIVKRGINSFCAILIAISEVGFSAAAVWCTGVGDYSTATIFTSLAGFVSIADNSLRIRELASSQNSRINQLNEILLQMDKPKSGSPYWGDYISVMTSNTSIDYIHSVIGAISRKRN